MNLLAYILGKKYTDAHNSATGAHGGNIGKMYDTKGSVWMLVWKGSQAEYDAIDPLDANTIYLIEEA